MDRSAILDQQVIYCRADSNGRITEANEAFRSWTGYNSSEITGLALHELCDWVPTDPAAEDMYDVVRRGETWRGHAKLVDKSGCKFWAQSKLMPAFDSEAKVGEIIWIGLDTTRDKRDEQVSRLEDAIFVNIAESARDAIVTADEKGRVVHWNPSCESLFGYSNSEIVGEPLTKIMPARFKEAHAAGLSRAVGSTELVLGGETVEVVGLRKDGSEVPIELSISRWIVQDRVMFTAIIRDVSQRKAFETSLMDARAAAEKADRAKSEFLSSMSHELRTPLNAILGFGQLLELQNHEINSESLRQAPTHVVTAGRQLLRMIDSLLDLTNVEAGLVEFDSTTLDPNRLIEEVAAEIKVLADARDIALSQEKQANALIEADRERLIQVVEQFLTNAIKFSHPSGVIEFGTYEHSPNRIRLYVRDYGRGISEELHTEMFQIFNRADHSTSHIAGAGVGLFVARKLVEAMDGEIGFQSREGEGSTFFADFPIVDADA